MVRNVENEINVKKRDILVVDGNFLNEPFSISDVLFYVENIVKIN